MSGHSKWSTIKREKGAKDAKRGAVFTRIGNQIAIAARSGTDPAMNSALALAIEKAKAANMPNANIQRAIDRVNDKNAAALEEVMYEGYGPGGVAIIVEATTDNKNRTYPEIRHALSKNGGNIAEPGSVAFQFTRRGVVRVALEGDPDEMLLAVLDSGAEDASVEDGEIVVYTGMKELHAVRASLQAAGMRVIDAELNFVAGTPIVIDDDETARKLLKLLDALDELDDVSNVSSNAEFADSLNIE